jgi:serine protease Do
MRSRRFARWTLPALLVAFSIAAPASSQDVKWDVNRTSHPEDVAELKALEAVVKTVIEKTTPATVGVLIGMGAGSGVIVSEDGLVLTAAHVSGPPDKDCLLILQDGRTVKGKTLGTNDKMDSGMIRITDKGPNNGKWPFVAIGKSDTLKKGQWVVSLGHPGGYKKDRPPVARLGRVMEPLIGFGPNKGLVQSNCTLVGGDSGGPLYDLDGKLVGIHSRIGLTLNTNIHVPTEQFKKEWDDLVAGVQVGKPLKAPVLGVTFDETAKNVLVETVYEDGPAYRSGLKDGDVITQFDGTKVAKADDVRALLAKRKAGEEVVLTVLRGTKTLSITVTLQKRE